MKSPSASRSQLWSISAALVLGAALLVLAPGKLHATTVTYDLTLTDPTNSTYSGTGILTMNVTTPLATYTDYYINTADSITGLSFVVDGQAFNLNGLTPAQQGNVLASSQPDPSVTIRDITFADTVGTGLSSLTLDTSGDTRSTYTSMA